MTPRKRIVTGHSPARAIRRRPTIRKLKPAIAPILRPPQPDPVARAGAPRTGPVRPSTVAPRVDGSATAGTSAPAAPRAVDLSVDLGRGLRLENPIVAAAGAFGFGVEQLGLLDVERLGAICTRGVTLRARAGNRPPRTADTPAGLLNGIGLQNPGIDAVLERYAPAWATWRVPVIVNIAADRTAAFVEIVQRLEGTAGIAGVELNLGCPNVGAGGMRFGLDAAAARAVTAAVRAATDLPLLVKLSPDAADVRAVARAVADAGADAISAVNTFPALAVTPSRDGLRLGSQYGGLSGPAIKPLALRVVAEIAAAVAIPVIGMGGITALPDVLDYLAVGATAIGIGTALFADPGLPVRLVDELAAACRAAGLDSHRSLVGRALPRRLAPSSGAIEYRP